MGKLYVGNLPFASTDDDLKACFEKVGEVKSAKVITDRETGRSRGFGFVEMDKSDEAIERLNETDLGGRNISVSVAKEREQRPRSGGRDNGGRGGYGR